MIIRCLLCLCVFVPISPCLAQDTTADKIRDSVRIPSIIIYYGIGFNSDNKLTFLGETGPTPGARIARLTRELTGTDRDAEALVELSYLYDDEEKVKSAAGKALELIRARIKRDPKNAESWILKGKCETTLKQYKQAEKTFRLATERFPDNSDCWIAYAEHLRAEGQFAYFGGNHEADFSLQGIFSLFLQRRVLPEDRIRGDRLLAKAKDCFDKAVSVAPNQPKPYAHRAGFTLIRNFMSGMVRVIEGKERGLNVKRLLFTSKALPDMQKVAELSPNSPRAIGLSAMFEVFSAIHENPDSRDDLPAKTKQSLARAITQLETIAKRNDKSTLADALYVHALILTYSEKVSPRCETLLDRAIRVNPNHSQAWDLLLVALNDSNKLKKQADVAEARLKLQDNPLTRFMAGSANFKRKNYNRAELHFKKTLKQNPDDLLNNLGLAAVLLKRSDRPGALAKLKPLFKRIDLLLVKSDKRAELESQVDIQRAAYYALTGEPGPARLLLHRTLQKDPTNEFGKQLSRVLEP